MAWAEQTEKDPPYVQRYDFYEPGGEGEQVEFRLIYRGPLPAESRSGKSASRTRTKHRIRKIIHAQLADLWKQQRLLRPYRDVPMVLFKRSEKMSLAPGPGMTQILYGGGKPDAMPWIEHLANEYERCGYRFVPLIREADGVTCSLDILFLRRDSPGNIVQSGGDIDNRIKVLLDGLKLPGSKGEIGDCGPGDGENPFFVLLEDDALITSITITTDRLLGPMEDGERIHDVHLVILVKTQLQDHRTVFP